MKVLLDTSCLQRTRAGAAVLTRGLLQGFHGLEEGPRILEAQPREGLRPFGLLGRKLDTAVTDLFWRQYVLPEQMRRQGVDLFHAPFLRLPSRIPVPWVANILDLYTTRRPEVFTRWSRLQNRRHDAVLAEAAALSCISHFTRRELLHFHPELDASRAHVVHLAASPAFHPAGTDSIRRVRETFGLAKPFFLVVGTIEPRKNVLALAKAYARVARELDHELIFVGGDGWVPDYVRQWKAVLRTAPGMRRLGHVDLEQLAALYSAARAFLFPTLYEGFGLPVLEAMRCACPVVASRGSSLDEVANGHAIQLDPEDMEPWIDAVRGLCRGEGFILEKERLERARQWAESFTWEKAALETYEVYRQALSASAR